MTAFLAGFTGLLCGSFVNLLIDRIPKGEQIIYGRSHCDHCRKSLTFWDLIPLFSFLLLKGRCRYCRRVIPRRNFWVEVTLGLLFYFNYLLRFQSEMNWSNFLLSTVVLSVLVAIFFIDLKHQIVPDRLTYPVITLLLLKLGWDFAAGLPKAVFLNIIFSGIIAAFFFILLIVFSRGRGLGFGDVKLVFLMGIFLGSPGIIYALYFAFLTGALVGVMLILQGKKRFGQTIPFAPFLITGTILAYFYHFLPL